MKAIVYEQYGTPDVLALREVDRPVPGPRDVLVRVHAVGVGAGDWHMLNATWFAVRLFQGLLRPKRHVLGHELSGVVEAVGAEITRFAPGDEVFGAVETGGAFAEYASVPEKTLVAKPADVTHQVAAATPVSALTALHGLRDKGGVRDGHRVLVNGASGGVGSFAVQLAKLAGAEVTGVCSTPKVEFVRSLGADHVVDYRRQDFTQAGERYDVVLDNVGSLPFAACRRALTPTGRYVAVSGAPSRTLRMVLVGGKRMVAFVSQANHEDLTHLADLLASGELKPAIDRTYPLAEVPDALRRLGAGDVRGKLVIEVAGEGYGSPDRP
jgi:NADPH:quinone reductase-like Zn-dependent oxidoreductase